MLSTKEVLDLLRRANPGRTVTEDRIRHELRAGRVPSPGRFAGRLVWTETDLSQLADALGLVVKL